VVSTPLKIFVKLDHFPKGENNKYLKYKTTSQKKNYIYPPGNDLISPIPRHLRVNRIYPDFFFHPFKKKAKLYDDLQGELLGLPIFRVRKSTLKLTANFARESRPKLPKGKGS